MTRPKADIPYSTFLPIERELDTKIHEAFERVLKSSWYIRGLEVKGFERQFSTYCGAYHCVGVGNGLDALTMVLVAMGVGAGDEVIVPSNTFIATALAVTRTGAKPVFVEPDI